MSTSCAIRIHDITGPEPVEHLCGQPATWQAVYACAHDTTTTLPCCETCHDWLAAHTPKIEWRPL